MTHPAVLAEEARRDIEEVFLWYESRGWRLLADDFLDEVAAALTAIEQFPELHRLVGETVRRAMLRRFPYLLAYQIRRGRIEVLRCMHVRRDPRLWML
jgi:plasmid stabilization system protein ParE